MCGPDKYNKPRHKLSKPRDLNLAEVFDPFASADEFGTITHESNRLYGPNVVLPCLPRSSEALLKETREDLTAKIRLARQRHRNNDEAAVKKVYYPVNPKQLCKFQTKDLGRNVNKDKRKQNYAYSRRE